jgi:hypothetical protein
MHIEGLGEREMNTKEDDITSKEERERNKDNKGWCDITERMISHIQGNEKREK